MKKKKKRKKHWLSSRGYVHFTTKFGRDDIESLKHYHAYTTTPKSVAQHAFFPLIHNSIITRRYKKLEDTSGKPFRAHSFINKKGKRESTAKKREIFYATHVDSIIYSYYTEKVLSPLYENAIKEIEGLSDCISAYRKIPVKGLRRNKNNIYFANDVIQFIKEKKNCTVLCFDVSKFFDSLNHRLLKKAWCKLLDTTALPDDHYNIFTSLTNFSYAEFHNIIKEFGYKNAATLRRKEVQTFCTDAKEFKKRVIDKGYVRPHPFFDKGKNEKDEIVKVKKGIPQGTAISAFLSNLYLLQFDIDLYTKLKSTSGFYRRYSDDIVVVCDSNDAKEIEEHVLKTIAEDYKLIINKDKIDKTEFFTDKGILKCKGSPLRYLGFEFDGRSVRLKQSSMAKFYRTMKKSVRSSAKRARHALKEKKDTKHGIIYKGKLFKRYSHLGGKGKTRNFPVYAKEAYRIIKDPALKKQMAKAWPILNNSIDRWTKKAKLKSK